MKISKTVFAVCAVLAVVCAVVAQDPKPRHRSSRKSQDKNAFQSPFPADAQTIKLDKSTMDDIFAKELEARKRLTRDFFTKPLSDQKSRLQAIRAFVGSDPFHGLKPTLDISNTGVIDAYKAYERYTKAAGIRARMDDLLVACEKTLFDPALLVRNSLKYYLKEGSETVDELFEFDDYISQLANWAPIVIRTYYEANPDGNKVVKIADIFKTAGSGKAENIEKFVRITGDLGKTFTLQPSFDKKLQTLMRYNAGLTVSMLKEYKKNFETMIAEELRAYKLCIEGMPDAALANAKVAALVAEDKRIYALLDKLLTKLVESANAMEAPEYKQGGARSGKNVFRNLSKVYSFYTADPETGPNYSEWCSRTVEIWGRNITSIHREIREAKFGK